MFLYELTMVLSARIQQEVLNKYRARPPKGQPKSPLGKPETNKKYAVDKLLDIDVLLRSNIEGLASVLKSRIIDNYKTQDEESLRRERVKKPLSALLFGPPGTSKTEITRAVADDLNWPLVEITPSEFVRGTLANVYLQADEIFDDLMDLSGVVVFFDEMDALVQTREGEIHLDIASQFLTTAMLPKLTRLHDQGRVVFFMATNYQERFDAAIKRAGRFDLLLCMGPPKLSEKLDRLQVAYSRDDETDEAQASEAGKLIQEFLKEDSGLRDQLDLYTFGEYRAFLKTVGKEQPIGDRIRALGPDEFRNLLRESSEYVTLRMKDLEPLHEQVKWEDLHDLRKKQFTLKEVERIFQEKHTPVPSVIRYLCDWQQSKEQY